MTRVSFCIPCYEAAGKGDMYLREIFYALEHQTNKDFNVWISDHSLDQKVLEVCREYCESFEINYIQKFQAMYMPGDQKFFCDFLEHIVLEMLLQAWENFFFMLFVNFSKWIFFTFQKDFC